MQSASLAESFNRAGVDLVNAGHRPVIRKARSLVAVGDFAQATRFLNEASVRLKQDQLSELSRALQSWQAAGYGLNDLLAQSRWQEGEAWERFEADTLWTETQGDYEALLNQLVNQKRAAGVSITPPAAPVGPTESAPGLPEADLFGGADFSESAGAAAPEADLFGGAGFSESAGAAAPEAPVVLHPPAEFVAPAGDDAATLAAMNLPADWQEALAPKPEAAQGEGDLAPTMAMMSDAVRAATQTPPPPAAAPVVHAAAAPAVEATAAEPAAAEPAAAPPAVAEPTAAAEPAAAAAVAEPAAALPAAEPAAAVAEPPAVAPAAAQPPAAKGGQWKILVAVAVGMALMWLLTTYVL